MINVSLQGMRCRAIRDIRNHRGMVRASTEGTVQYEFENFGRHLINVHWDNGLRLNVFADEIEIIDGYHSWQ
jgi:hypothetical protein